MARKNLSPSGESRWGACSAAPAMERGKPRTSTKYSAEGTAAHYLAACCLENDKQAAEFIGQSIEADGFTFDVTVDMAEAVQFYVDSVRDSVDGGVLFVEQELQIDHITDEEGATGTADAVIINGPVLEVHDLKFGMGVKVDAVHNGQLAIYADAAIRKFDFLDEVETVRMVIVQPRLGHVSEWVLTRAELDALIADISARASKALDVLARQAGGIGPVMSDFSPSEKACKFCSAKAECPALAKHVLLTVGAEFDDLTQPIEVSPGTVRGMQPASLARCREAVELIEDWCLAVRTRVDSVLKAGDDVPGWKLVAGRKGSRKWADDSIVAKVLAGADVDHELYAEWSIKGVPAIEKAAKSGDVPPEVWSALQDLITQTDGKPVAVPESDKRPAYQPNAVNFDDETTHETLEV